MWLSLIVTGFRNVYKVQIRHHGMPTSIAARRLDRRHGQGDIEFWTEISVLSSLSNDYIVELIGYVDEQDEKIIINRDCAKGSVLMYLSDPTLTWRDRLRISTGLGCAINYIHHELKQGYHIIHRNINTFTILLNNNWWPKLSGFEFCIKHPVDRRNQVFLCDEAIGTQGYMDPADLKYGGVTSKSDIYSLGVVLFELLCRRKAKDDQDNNQLLASLAKFHYKNGTLQDIIHPDLWSQMDQESFKCFSKVAYSCLKEDRTQRPNMELVLNLVGICVLIWIEK
uniref:putative receptor-like protein kinase At5g39000 n=1 Tax=Erigeron canadensis TaxID=72917 RepID=UPI001CB9A709|nr:putative receptor-like protein kinase At5g39000 [Erigeron canadensis]